MYNIRKEYKELRELDFSKDEIKEIFSNVSSDEVDFMIGDYRFIADSDIDDIQKRELSDDLYLLGCFTDWFIADILELDLDVVQALQKAEAFEAIGKMMLKHIDEVQEKYRDADGYGHHFNPYDGGDNEINVMGKFYHVFRTN